MASPFEYDGGGNPRPAAAGELTTIIDEGGQSSYSCDAYGSVSAITVSPVNANGLGVSGSTQALLSGITCNADSQVTGWLWSDGKARSIGYDSVGMVASYTLGDPSGTGTAAGLLRTVQRDAAGRITGYTHSNNGSAVPGLAQSFGYDNLDRLTAATQGASSTQYSYDATGNRTAKTIAGSTYTNTVSATSNRLTQVQDVPGTATVNYDATGNIVGDGSFTYAYSDRGRMASVTTASGTVSYLYNGLGQRVRKSGPAALVATGAGYFVYDEAGQLLGEYDANGAPVYETIYLGSMPVGAVKTTGSAANGDLAASLYNVHADHIDTPRVITRQDHAIVWRWDAAEAFGATAPDQNPSGLGTFAYNQRFAGQVFDAETGLFQNWNREYNARTGRYIQSDPIGLKGGINTFSYVDGSPLSFADPNGLARIQTPEFSSFAEANRWRRKYKDLYDANDTMRERIKKNCPSLLAQFDNWTVSVDPNIDNPVKRSRGFYAFGNFTRQSTQFNKSFFDLGSSQSPSQGDVFAHEFRHMMKTNADLFRPGDEMRDPLTVPGEMDADAWARKFWQEKCECGR